MVVVSFAAAAGVALWVIRSHWPEGGAPLGLSWWAHLLALGAVTFELTLRSAKIAFSARACGIPLQVGPAARAPQPHALPLAARLGDPVAVRHRGPGEAGWRLCHGHHAGTHRRRAGAFSR